MADAPSLHDTLSAAYDSMVGETTTTPEPGPAVETATEVPAPQDGAPTPATTSSRPRDEQGRFAPKTETTKDPSAAAKTAPATPATEDKGKGDGASVTTSTPPPSPEPAKPAAETYRPPSSFKPSVREVWGKVPTEVQAEIVRVDREVRATMQRAAEREREADTYRQAFAPYEGMIRDSGATHPVQVVQNLLATARVLRYGTPVEKAQMAARIVKDFGVPIDALDGALAGVQPAPGTQSAAIDPALVAQQAEARIMQRLQAQAAQVANTRNAATLASFAEKHEFFEDVRERMADILAARRQPNPSEAELAEVYDLACRVHPDISGVIRQREAAKAAETAKAATQRAQAAASSVKSSPAGAPPNANPKGLRSILENRYDELTRG